uniref:SH3 domain-binding glutamic acid-rich-like protein 3 n=1 Tax=Gopherus evgoodei TaxID=1825980 RepID=A0A8C4YFX6_9SAUR
MSNIYCTSVGVTGQVKQKQAEVTRILDINKTKYELIDVSISEHLLQEMRAKAGNPTAVPPQIFNGDDYCGVRKKKSRFCF